MLLKLLILFSSMAFANMVSSKPVSNNNLKDFDKGESFDVCMKKCRHHHREVLKLPHGAGKGSCWMICEEKHPYEKNKN